MHKTVTDTVRDNFAFLILSQYHKLSKEPTGERFSNAK